MTAAHFKPDVGNIKVEAIRSHIVKRIDELENQLLNEPKGDFRRYFLQNRVSTLNAVLRYVDVVGETELCQHP